jgi:hypothetical protein
MDASTLFYLSKIASSYPGMAAAAAAAAAASNNSETSPTTLFNSSMLPSIGNNFSYDPSVLNSMAETYLRRMCTDPGSLSFNSSINILNNNSYNNSTASSPCLSSSSSSSSSLSSTSNSNQQGLFTS